MNDGKPVDLKGRFAAILGALLFVSSIAHADEWVVETTGIASTEANARLFDATKTYAWKPSGGQWSMRRLAWRGDALWQGPWQFDWRQEEVQLRGVIGRYRCVIMCGWMSNQTLDPGAPLDQLNYRLDHLRLSRPELMAWTWKAFDLALLPHSSINFFSGTQTGDTQTLSLSGWPTLGLTSRVAWRAGDASRLIWQLDVDGVQFKGVRYADTQQRLEWAYRLSPQWELGLGVSQHHRRLTYAVDGDELKIDQRGRAWSVVMRADW